jgi:hypothetical protein
MTVAVLLSLTAPHAALARAPATLPFIVGNWYGEKQPWSDDIIWLSHERPDGRFEIRFRQCKGGKTLQEHLEAGTWRFENGVEEIVTATVDGKPAPRRDTYRTISYDGRKHVYRHRESGYTFSAVRVGETFRLPSCAMTS